jgi:outer membrane protein OmpA-like peptidoglycan-associated protein
MKHLLVIFLLFFVRFVSNGQANMAGTWQGIMIKDGTTAEQASLIYLTVQINGETIEGKTRNEIYNTDFFAVKKIKGTYKNNELFISEFVVEKKKNSSKITWCNINATLLYSDSTGYLTGKYTSTDCKRNTGKIILYKSKAVFSSTETSPLSHTWFPRFTKDLSKGYNAPEIREKERSSFQFQPIYFDYDKAEIKPENIAFLKKIIRVVDGHSDLRIKVTGHTDGDGSDAYNEELSKKRAQALIDFFIANGLSRDRIVLDFKGEKQPIDNNLTPEGKQRNRRVDFSFI